MGTPSDARLCVCVCACTRAHVLRPVSSVSQGAESPVLTAETDKAKILDVAFGDSAVVTVGVNHVSFWDTRGRVLKGTRGLFTVRALCSNPCVYGGASKLTHASCVFVYVGTLQSNSKATMQPVVSAAWFDGRAVTGTVSGHLYVWKGSDIEAIVRAHDDTVNSLYVAGRTLITGGKDGKVNTWDTSFKRGANVDTKGRVVRSVASSDGGSTFLVGLGNADIITLDASGHETLLAEGHSYGELWALAVHPTNKTFVTAGDDKCVASVMCWCSAACRPTSLIPPFSCALCPCCRILRVWDRAAHRCVAKAQLDTWVRTASYSPDGKHIAVGTGGRLGGLIPEINGAFYVLDSASLRTVSRGQESKRAISQVKYSPDGKTLAIGSHDGKIYLHDATRGYALRNVLTGHNSYITQLDFSTDSKHLQSNCGAYELLFWDVDAGAQDPSGASHLRDTEWATWTCVLGWPVQGIWPAFADGTDINSVDRSKSKKLLATADDFGKIKLFNYPAVTPGSMSSAYGGHSSHVTNLRWTNDDAQIISIGGNDKSVFQWYVNRGRVLLVRCCCVIGVIVACVCVCVCMRAGLWTWMLMTAVRVTRRRSWMSTRRR